MKKAVITFGAMMVFAFCAMAIANDHGEGSEAQGMPHIGPPPEMAELSHLTGTWTGDFHMRMDPKADWIVSPATQVFESVLGGCAIRSHFSTKMMGTDFKGQMTMTYHRSKKEWQSVWVDNFGAQQTLMIGGPTEDGKKIVMEGEAIEMGVHYLMRDVTIPKSDTEFDWEMHVSYDKGETWWMNMKGTYTKEAS